MGEIKYRKKWILSGKCQNKNLVHGWNISTVGEIKKNCFAKITIMFKDKRKCSLESPTTSYETRKRKMEEYRATSNLFWCFFFALDSFAQEISQRKMFRVLVSIWKVFSFQVEEGVNKKTAARHFLFLGFIFFMFF